MLCQWQFSSECAKRGFSRLPVGTSAVCVINWVSSFPPCDPRSSNGRTAAFGAVNRGSNPCRGANLLRIINLQAYKSPLYNGWYKNRVYNPVVPYRRHSVDCRVHKLKLSASEKKFFTDCDCPIWVTGSTDTETYPRQALGVRDWPAAEAKLRSLSAASKDQTVHGPRLEDCIKRYLDARDDVKPKTLAQYELLLGR
jgi:hypothetical protein